MCLLILERGGGRERDKHRSMASHKHPQPGIECTTFWCMGWCSNQLTHPARAEHIFKAAFITQCCDYSLKDRFLLLSTEFLRIEILFYISSVPSCHLDVNNDLFNKRVKESWTSACSWGASSHRGRWTWAQWSRKAPAEVQCPTLLLLAEWSVTQGNWGRSWVLWPGPHDIF